MLVKTSQRTLHDAERDDEVLYACVHIATVSLSVGLRVYILPKQNLACGVNAVAVCFRSGNTPRSSEMVILEFAFPRVGEAVGVVFGDPHRKIEHSEPSGLLMSHFTNIRPAFPLSLLLQTCGERVRLQR
jgi:hypothetical protein